MSDWVLHWLRRPSQTKWTQHIICLVMHSSVVNVWEDAWEPTSYGCGMRTSEFYICVMRRGRQCSYPNSWPHPDMEGTHCVHLKRCYQSSHEVSVPVTVILLSVSHMVSVWKQTGTFVSFLLTNSPSHSPLSQSHCSHGRVTFQELFSYMLRILHLPSEPQKCLS